jgi:hypothetical protein
MIFFEKPLLNDLILLVGEAYLLILVLVMTVLLFSYNLEPNVENCEGIFFIKVDLFFISELQLVLSFLLNSKNELFVDEIFSKHYVFNLTLQFSLELT